ncbi:MAG: DUF58 domain-containing protein [Deltaproteobacteria bacterium]|nr:DUF58 domain-containing protein [Deltaproteobacteria bacterium]
MLPEPFTTKFLAQLEALRLRTRKEFLGSHPGSYSSPRRGTSLEFADYRRYAPGDDLRYLDWGIYARSDRLYVKVFREEVDLFAYVFIDASASMSFPSVAQKFRPASHIAAALSYVVLANHDHVKLHLLQGNSAAHASPFYRGRRRMADCVQFASQAAPSGTLDLAGSLGAHLQRIHRPGKAILVSDFLMPPSAYQSGLNLLRAFNLDIAAIQVLSRQELAPNFGSGTLELVDSESGATLRQQWDSKRSKNYQERLAHHNSEIRSFCHQSGIHYSLYVTDRDLGDFVLATLPKIGLFK